MNACSGLSFSGLCADCLEEMLLPRTLLSEALWKETGVRLMIPRAVLRWLARLVCGVQGIWGLEGSVDPSCTAGVA